MNKKSSHYYQLHRMKHIIKKYYVELYANKLA
jgi:hypothetical protein